MGYDWFMCADTVHQVFTDALDALIEQVKRDRSILAAILCGSLSHDRVWEKSDVDLVLVTVDDRKAESEGACLYADGVNVHACLMQRSEFRKVAEGALRNSFMHSLLAKGRLLYTHDESIEELYGDLAHIGARDTSLALLRAGTSALPPLYKAHKWFVTRGDLDYTALWILYTATPVAQIEVMGRGLLADREVVPQAAQLNPELFASIYTGMLHGEKTREGVQVALDVLDGYIANRVARLFGPINDYLREAGDERSASEMEHFFDRNYGISGVTTACEYLADQELIGKASVPLKLTKISNVEVQELAFFYTGEFADAI